VSLRWNRSVRLRVGLHGVSGTLARAWPRAATIASAHRAVDAAPAESDKGIHSIEPVLRDLERSESLRGAELTADLSDALVHLDVIAGDFVANTDRQLQAIASACAAELLGEDFGTHELRWQLQPGGQHLLVCAIPRSHLTELARAASACGLRLASAQPDFVRQWNAHAGALRPGPSVFAVAAGANLAIASVINGVISAISVGPLVCATASSDDSAVAALDERAVAAEQLDSRIGGLLLHLGLDAHARGAFAPSQPNPLDVVEMLDARVDRLLTGIGQDPSAQSAFVLVTPDGSSPKASRRWAVRGETGATA
jgi:hypothetical protein